MAVIERIHLEIMRAVEQEGSLTAAAAKLNLTQSALSHTVSKLEERIGIKLWRREGRGLHPTQAGDFLSNIASRMLPQLEHAEERLRQFATGARGTLRIGMECHPCYQWLLKIIAPYLEARPYVDVDVRQKFRFGGIGALFGYEIDMLVTPDPLYKAGLHFTPVFDYEQVLVVGAQHPLCGADFVLPHHLADETLISYPVPAERLDIYTQFLTPAGVTPRQHRSIETTDIMLLMVAHGRGVAALPRWLVEESTARFNVHAVRLGENGVFKQIFLGLRESDGVIDYIRTFIDLGSVDIL